MILCDSLSRRDPYTLTDEHDDDTKTTCGYLFQQWVAMVAHVSEPYESVIANAFFCLRQANPAYDEKDSAAAGVEENAHTLGDISAQIISNTRGTAFQYPVSKLCKYIDHMVVEGKIQRQKDIDTYKLANPEQREACDPSLTTSSHGVKQIITHAIHLLNSKCGIPASAEASRRRQAGHTLDTILHQIEIQYGDRYWSRGMLQNYLERQKDLGTIDVETQTVYRWKNENGHPKVKTSTPDQLPEKFLNLRGETWTSIEFII